MTRKPQKPTESRPNTVRKIKISVYIPERLLEAAREKAHLLCYDLSEYLVGLLRKDVFEPGEDAPESKQQ